MKLNHDEFAEFWAKFPRRVAKVAAMKAYVKARKSATADEIIAGIDRYMAHKPAYADWCHPTTFLSQGRWLDEYDTPRVQTRTVDWWEQCKALHGGACTCRWDHDTRMLDERQQGNP
jgi:allantoicase